MDRINQATKQSIKEFLGIDVDSELLNPIHDYVFKRLFTADEKRSKLALMDLLNSILELESENPIEDLTVVNPEIPVDTLESKKSRFDIRVKFKNGEQAIVEMQLSDKGDFKKRSQYIISKAYSSQEIAGRNYKALKKCYLICITNFAVLKSKTEFVNDYRYRDREGNDLTADETIIFLELPKIEKIINKPIEKMTNLEMWTLFFRYVTDESKREILNSIISRKDGINMAAMILYEISGDEQERIRYENALIAELDHNSDIYAAEERGEYNKSFQIAKNALLKGSTIEFVSEITGLAIEEIKQVQQEILV